MTEVNYNNTAPAAEPVGTDLCSESAPCSLGIFMEGGESNESILYSDRWMFDPTANAGMGHWQRVDGFPPRHLAAMSTVDYFVPSTNSYAHRAILFGGETALASPAQATGSNCGAGGGLPCLFVPPTLGDTWMFDFDTNTWNRVELLGKGYYQLVPADITDEFEKRQAYSADAPVPTNISVLTPPPLAGATMVTRTKSTLKIPEVFLFGGRLKTGKFNTLGNVYKFCAGSTGETSYNTNSPTDTSCDAFDATSNTDSPSPVLDYKGRWLKKEPAGEGTLTSTTFSSYLGAGVYDSVNDRILLYGGIGDEDGTMTAVTDYAANGSASKPTSVLGSEIYEYSPPLASHSTDVKKRNGYWTRITACTGYTGATAPAARYGHSLGYDALNEQLVVAGGYSATGDYLRQYQYDASSGSYYYMPEVWAAKRINDATGVPSEITDAGETIASFPCYYWRNINVFGSTSAQTPSTTSLAHAASVFIPSAAYNTSYYTMMDNSCSKAGPIASSDDAVNKLLAGGVYIDIDRSELGPNENLLLNITYIPLGTGNKYADGSSLTSDETARLNIHLMTTGAYDTLLQQLFQPRHIHYADTGRYPKIVDTLAVLAPPTGVARTEQVVIPIAVNQSVDRIRIERYSGSAILVDAKIFRLGYK